MRVRETGIRSEAPGSGEIGGEIGPKERRPGPGPGPGPAAPPPSWSNHGGGGGELGGLTGPGRAGLGRTGPSVCMFSWYHVDRFRAKVAACV